MNIRLPLLASAVGIALLGACLDFSGAYRQCIESGMCGDDAGVIDTHDSGSPEPDGGEPDAGEMPDAGSPSCPDPLCFEQKLEFPGSIMDIAMISPTDVWAVGTKGGKFHWDGKVWISHQAAQDSREFHAVWGPSSGLVWAVGYTGDSQLYRDARWHPVPDLVNAAGGLVLKDISGVSEQLAWAVGEQGTILELTDGNWRKLPGLPLDQTYEGIWVSPSSDDGLIVGRSSAALRRTAGSWLVMNPAPPPGEDLNAVWGTSFNGGTQFFAVSSQGNVHRYQPGIGWSSFSTEGLSLFAISGTSENDVFIGGQGGFLAHSSGGAWETVRRDELTRSMTVLSIFTPDAHTLWVAGYDTSRQVDPGFILRYRRGP